MPSTDVRKFPASESSVTRSLLLHNQRPIDAATRQRAMLHWLDWIGCVAAAAHSPVVGVLRRWEMTPGAPRTHAALLGMAQDRFHSMLLDAGPANVEEMDDLHRQAILHPGPVVIPALANLARTRPMRAGQVLDALVRGYEVMIRVGRAVGRRHYFYWHNTATAGVYGAAAACADALGLPLENATWALGNAGTQAAGLWQVRLEPVMSKQLHTAHAAWAGLTAASLAAAGFSGPAHILEGERGFFAAMCEDADTGGITRTEKDWLIHETTFKPWPACRHTHGTIDCVLALRQQCGDAPLAFTNCTVETFGDALSICDNVNPATRTEAKFSLQYCVAATAQFGPLRPSHFDESCFNREDLQAGARRVLLKPASDIDAAYPDHYGARVTMTLPNGKHVTQYFRDSLGDPERPLSTQSVLDKANELMAYGGVPPARAREVIDAARAVIDDACVSNNLDVNPWPPALLRPLFVTD